MHNDTSINRIYLSNMSFLLLPSLNSSAVA